MSLPSPSRGRPCSRGRRRSRPRPRPSAWWPGFAGKKEVRRIGTFEYASFEVKSKRDGCYFFVCVALFVIYIGRRGSNMQCGEFSISMWRTIQIGGDLFVRQMALLLHVSAYYVILAMQKAIQTIHWRNFFLLFFRYEKNERLLHFCIFAKSTYLRQTTLFNVPIPFGFQSVILLP